MAINKNFIFLTGQYLPSPGATGLCVHQIAKILVARGHNVHVVCYGNRCFGDLQIDGVIINRVKEPFFLSDASGKSIITRKFARLCSLLSKLIHANYYPLRSCVLKNRLKAELNKLISTNADSIVVSTFNPLEACIALLEEKKRQPSIKAVYYSTDTLSNERGNSGFISPERRTKLGLRWEHKFFGTFNKILIMECHEDYYRTDVFKPYFNKYLIANFPLLCKSDNSYEDIVTSHKRKLLVYAGTLYRELRNPQYLCELLCQAKELFDFEALFIGGGDCNDIVNSFKEKTGGAIHHDGMVSHNEASKWISESDILLSIGNNESPMAPSKIYEYMATCKPIIHIYTWGKDPCLEPLRKYGNSLLIKEKSGISIETLVTFLKTSKKVDRKKVFETFKTSTPEYSADLLETI